MSFPPGDHVEARALLLLPGDSSDTNTKVASKNLQVTQLKRETELKLSWRCVFGAAVVGATLIVAGLPTWASTTSPVASYPLGSAANCKAHYVERILSHKVKGKKAQYIACVYAAKKTTAPVTTTTEPVHTATSAPPGQLNAVPNVVNEELDLAEATLLTDHLGYNVIGGGIFGVVVASNPSSARLDG